MDALAYLTPHRIEISARARGCLICTNFQGWFYAGHLLCERDGGRYVVGVPAIGCAFWQREPGADDCLRSLRFGPFFERLSFGELISAVHVTRHRRSRPWSRKKGKKVLSSFATLDHC
jgi:hypothetical protein